jgi:tetratricopeptide (TPR) repeat protein
MNQQLPELALSNYQEALNQVDSLPLATSLTTARNLSRFGAFEEAKTFVDNIFDVYSDDLSDAQKSQLYNLQAEIALAFGNDAEAAEILEMVVSVDPLNGDALILLGDYFTRTGEYEEAQFYYERAQSVSESRVEALIQHARMRVSRRDYREAVRLLEQAQSIRPRQNVENYLNAVRAAQDALR